MDCLTPATHDGGQTDKSVLVWVTSSCFSSFFMEATHSIGNEELEIHLSTTKRPDSFTPRNYIIILQQGESRAAS